LPFATRRQWKTYKLEKGPKFALERKKPATELTQEMLAKWVCTAAIQSGFEQM